MQSEKQIIIYLHGFRSNENGSKVDHLKKFFPECEVFGLSYDPHKPADAAKAINDIIKEIGVNNIKGFVGTSLGGFWVRWAAVQHKLVAVAINPSLEPWKTLTVGVYNKFGSELNIEEEIETKIEVTEADLEVYPQYSVDIEEVNTSVLHIFALDDELLDSRKSIEMVGNRYPPQVYATAGHRFENFERLKNPIRDRFYGKAV
ncbi:MAG: hypothetical protein HRU38_15030 [Saccharospirillaceae bacterium]|nr:hypothetical protein [Pseudomonadales bacterium]NRB79955.1 hypothetical protein [Saccharospirillaceae bacterium]